MWTHELFRPRFWPEMERLQEEMNRLFSGTWRGPEAAWDLPRVNVWSGGDDLVLTAEVPGMDPKSLDVSVIGDTVTLSGERRAEEDIPEEDYHRQERIFGRFSRTLNLPFTVDADRVSAGYRKGILTITLPRAEADKPRKVSVKAA